MSQCRILKPESSASRPFEDLVGAKEERLRDCGPGHLRGLEIEFGRLPQITVEIGLVGRFPRLSETPAILRGLPPLV
jgi:hypothetical protein